MEAMSFDRDQALTFIISVLQQIEPTERLTVYRSDGTIIISPERDQQELLAWAKETGDQYEDVFQRLAE